jgi:hypothetical protein
MNPPVTMPFSVLYRIDRYREILRSYTQTTNIHNHDNQSHLLPNGGSRDEQRSSHLRHGRTVDGGEAASGVSSYSTIIGDGEREGS